MEKKSFLSIYAKSFNWAGFFLPKETYLKCSNLYDFCRTLDNIADDESAIDVKLRRFLNFKNNFFNKEFQNRIIENMWVLMNEYNISTKIVDDFRPKDAGGTGVNRGRYLTYQFEAASTNVMFRLSGRTAENSGSRLHGNDVNPILNAISIETLAAGAAINNLSAHSLVAPYRLTGPAALSVLRATTFFTFESKDACMMFSAPKTLVLTNSIGLYSAAGTCFRAAA